MALCVLDPDHSLKFQEKEMHFCGKLFDFLGKIRTWPTVVGEQNDWSEK